MGRFFTIFDRRSRTPRSTSDAGNLIVGTRECTLHPGLGGSLDLSPFGRKDPSKVQFRALFGLSRSLNSKRETAIVVANAHRYPLSPSVGAEFDLPRAGSPTIGGIFSPW